MKKWGVAAFLSLVFVVCPFRLAWSESGVALPGHTHSFHSSFPSNFFAVDMPIHVKSDQPEVTVRLPANRSTGYSWVLVSYDKEAVTPISSHYNPPAEGQIGATGESVWVFRVNDSAFQVPHVIRIRMAYVKPSEMNFTNIKTILLMTEPANTSQDLDQNKGGQKDRHG